MMSSQKQSKVPDVRETKKIIFELYVFENHYQKYDAIKFERLSQKLWAPN